MKVEAYFIRQFIIAAFIKTGVNNNRNCYYNSKQYEEP